MQYSTFWYINMLNFYHFIKRRLFRPTSLKMPIMSAVYLSKQKALRESLVA